MADEIREFTLKLEHQDIGYCRVIYSYTAKSGRKSLYCVQEEFKDAYMIYSCSHDEEPIAEVNFKEGVIVKFQPSGDKGTDKFLKERDLLLE